MLLCRRRCLPVYNGFKYRLGAPCRAAANACRGTTRTALRTRTPRTRTTRVPAAGRRRQTPGGGRRPSPPPLCAAPRQGSSLSKQRSGGPAGRHQLLRCAASIIITNAINDISINSSVERTKHQRKSINNVSDAAASRRGAAQRASLLHAVCRYENIWRRRAFARRRQHQHATPRVSSTARAWISIIAFSTWCRLSGVSAANTAIPSGDGVSYRHRVGAGATARDSAC